MVAVAVAACAPSPFDLIPDFVPVLGCLDDLIIVPLGFLLVAKMIPTDLLAEFRAEAARLEAKPKSHAGAAMIVLLWMVVAALLMWWLLPRFAG